MSVYRPPKIPPSEITPRVAYLRRREFLAGAAGAGLFAAGVGSTSADTLDATKGSYVVDEPSTPFKDVTT